VCRSDCPLKKLNGNTNAEVVHVKQTQVIFIAKSAKMTFPQL